MKNKKGNVAVIALIALIIVIVAITTGVITWLVATKTQAPVQQAVVTQPVPVAKTQPIPTPVPTVQSTPATTNSQNYIEVKELGFKVPVASEMVQQIICGIGFKDKFNDFSNKAYFSTKELSKYKGCAEWPGAFTVEKISGKPTDEKNKVFEMGGGNKKIVLDGVIKQFDGFFLFANYTTQDSCSDMKALDAEGA